MKTITGTYSSAIVYTDIIEETAEEQIKLLCDQPFVKGSRIRIMPDVHAGKGCVIGFTADLGDMVIPNIVGVDIGLEKSGSTLKSWTKRYGKTYPRE